MGSGADTNDSQIGMIRNWVLQCNNQTITMPHHYHFFTTFVCQANSKGKTNPTVEYKEILI